MPEARDLAEDGRELELAGARRAVHISPRADAPGPAQGGRAES